MSRHDQMMQAHVIPALMGHHGDAHRVVCFEPNGATPIPLAVAGVGPVGTDDEDAEIGEATESHKVERMNVSIAIESVTPGLGWRVVIDDVVHLPWTVDEISTEANGAATLHLVRGRKARIRRRGFEEQ